MEAIAAGREPSVSLGTSLLVIGLTHQPLPDSPNLETPVGNPHTGLLVAKGAWYEVRPALASQDTPVFPVLFFFFF